MESANAHGLTGVQEPLLVPLSARVLESRREDSGFRDPEAERIAAALQADFGVYSQDWTHVEAVVGRTEILDRAVRDWLARHPGGRVVNLGAGLCTRFHRVDDGAVRWLDLDLPDVVALKRGLLAETDRYRVLAGSVVEAQWMEAVGHGPWLFVAEGLLMYLSEAQVGALLANLAARFPGAQMWLEAVSPFLLRTLGRSSRSIGATGATFDWGLADPSTLERLLPGAKVLGVEYPSEVHPERWRWMRIFRYVRPIHTALKCVHLQLPHSVAERSAYPL